MENDGKVWWVYEDSGECVRAVTVEEAISILQPRYRGYQLTPENVVPESSIVWNPVQSSCPTRYN